jgi:hypothetical protein
VAEPMETEASKKKKKKAGRETTSQPAKTGKQL